MARSEILKLAKEKEVEIRYVHRRVLEHLTGKSIHEVSQSFELASIVALKEKHGYMCEAIY